VAELRRRKRSFKFSLQVLSLFVVMGAVPWLGYQFISEAKQFLDSGQLISQEQFGRSVANTFYNKKKSLSLSLAAGAPLPKTYLATPITVDGSQQDWQDHLMRCFLSSKVCIKHMCSLRVFVCCCVHFRFIPATIESLCIC